MLKFLLFLVPIVLMATETVDITPPNLSNMDNYELLRKKQGQNSKPVVMPIPTQQVPVQTIQPSVQQPQQAQQSQQPQTLPNIIGGEGTEIQKNQNQQVIYNNELPKQQNNDIINNNQPQPQQKVIYNKVISNDVIDTPSFMEECTLTEKNIYKKGYELGYKYGLRNSKVEIENWFLKMSTQLNDLFLIKEYYIEGILEPPLIEFDKEDLISENGKKFTKKEGEFTIIKEAKFKVPLTWKDFLLTDNLEKAEYNLEYYYYNDKEKCPIKNEKIEYEFKNGYEEGRKEANIIYSQRLAKLKDYMEKLHRYQRLYLTRKMRPPVITPLITPITADKNKMVISQEEYTIVKPAQFNTAVKDWQLFLIETRNANTNNQRAYR